ncbi:MAG: PBP1A family penicillin-binding protein [Spirochaetia bacterium]|nr:PBP1A family penicillin-binding protein [Spirochaetia bacterium]
MKDIIWNFINKFFGVDKLEKISIVLFLFISFFGGIFLGIVVTDVESGNLSKLFHAFEDESKKEKQELSDIQKLESFRMAVPTRIYDINGTLIAELFQHKRELVKLEEIPRPVVNAFLAVEDTSFYDHFGIDFIAILRAAWENIKSGSIVQGGSTITQQLVKSLYTEGEKTLVRKLYEAVLALQVEKVFSKDEILEMYFNQIYLGHGVKGIATASKLYFDKPIQKLNFIEGSILAALPKSPHTYSPYKNPHRCREKNKIVLNRMVELEYISRETADKMYEEFWPKYWDKITTTPSSITAFGLRKDKAPYFTETVRQELIDIFGEEKVYSKGLQVYTSLDLDQQSIAEEILSEALKKQDATAQASNQAYRKDIDTELFLFYDTLKSILPLPEIQTSYSIRTDFRKTFKENSSDYFELLSLILPAAEVNEISKEFSKTTRQFKRDIQVQGAFLAMEPNTGRITAMIGGREFKPSDQYNRALHARRQPGSAFKPFVYGAAIEDRAVHYSMGFTDSPLMNVRPDGSIWAPSNYEGSFRGYIPLNKALAQSKNLVSIQVYDLIGPEKIIDFASRLMKISYSRFQPDPSLALGSSEVTPYELLWGFSIIANEGKDIVPHSIIYVKDRDEKMLHIEKKTVEILNRKEKNNNLQIIEPETAWMLKKMMKEVVKNGTGTRAIVEDNEFYGDAAGKTGTTSSWNDAWFAGFTKELAGVVWVGMDKGAMTLGKHQSGGVICAPVWGKFMKRLYDLKKEKPGQFESEIPEKVETKRVCKFSGKWFNEDCDIDEETMTTYTMPKIEKDFSKFDEKQIEDEEKIKKNYETICDCNHTQTRNFLELLQEQSEITDEELGKTKHFSGRYGND